MLDSYTKRDEFVPGKTVASFGDGPGRYKQLLLETGKVKGYDAFDGAPFSEKNKQGQSVVSGPVITTVWDTCI